MIAGAGAITSQKINGQPINTHAIFAYVSFAGCIGAPFSHYFYELVIDQVARVSSNLSIYSHPGWSRGSCLMSASNGFSSFWSNDSRSHRFSVAWAFTACRYWKGSQLKKLKRIFWRWADIIFQSHFYQISDSDNNFSSTRLCSWPTGNICLCLSSWTLTSAQFFCEYSRPT